MSWRMRPMRFALIVNAMLAFTALERKNVGVHTGRGRLNYHALKGRPCTPLLRRKRAKLVPGFASQVEKVEATETVSSSCFNGQCFVWGANPPQTGVG
eukprot:1317603-Amphidinium_carterae.1